MALQYHPRPGSIITVNYEMGFQTPEMTKKRLAVVLSPDIKSRPNLVTIVPLSLTEPKKIHPFNKLITIPFPLPKTWGNMPRWVKGDMVNAVGFHRTDLLVLGKDKTGKRVYQLEALPDDSFKQVKRCVLHGMGMSALTKHL